MNAFARFVTMVMDAIEKSEDPKEMEFANFIDELEREVREFKIYWAQHHLDSPDIFPRTLPSREDWTEQFITWLGMRGS